MTEGIDPKVLAAAIKKRQREALKLCFDPNVLESRPNPAQLEILRDIEKIPVRYCVAGNQSGKSTLVARELAWILNGEHPFWTRPKRWGDKPLLVIVAGQTRQIIETELWRGKLLRFLNAADWKEDKKPHGIIGARNLKTGDEIVFIPHGDGSEDTIRNMQSYVANYVWLDEMPKSTKVLTELLERVIAMRGYLLASFTPLQVNAEIRRIIDASDGIHAKRYRMSKLDNPRFAKERERLIAATAGMTIAERNTRLYGEWAVASTAVFAFEPEKHVAELPKSYDPLTWEHVEAIDPALSSKTGYVLVARDPETKVWYTVKADYIEGKKGKDPNEACLECYNKGAGYRIVRRVSDVANWFTPLMYNSYGYTYLQPYNKNSRKAELISGLQKALSDGILKVTPECELLIEEFTTCRWSETAIDKIVGSQHYHLLDALQYFVDCRPKREEPKPERKASRDEQLMRAFEEEKKKQALVKKINTVQKISRRRQDLQRLRRHKSPQRPF
jgi:hypothetical protein